LEKQKSFQTFMVKLVALLNHKDEAQHKSNNQLELHKALFHNFSFAEAHTHRIFEVVI
jgi:hypothetical protein